MSDYENVNMTPDYENVKADYTPTTEEVRDEYALYAWSDKFERSRRSDSFDRWLAEHDRQKQAAALRDAALSGNFGTSAQSVLLAMSKAYGLPYRKDSESE